MRGFFSKICKWLLALLGVSSAASCGLGSVEYGVPHCDFEVKCTVIDSKTKADVNGVQMTPGTIYKSDIEEDVSVYIFEPYSGTQTTVNGTVNLDGKIYVGAGRNFDELHIRLKDPDPMTAGNYRDTIYVVPLKKLRDSKKGSSWNNGTYGAEITLEAEQVTE